ncbi:hypothetical protein CY34DRAFT_814429 [Suillus luteus UH-Slu-Lm8-n1]|uniref:Uncharacterized protein n=1 Tax=Suillus luteus UH-Slu-Lm8-n1 TaxID=930992 RepID=A0A0D0ACU4_9AGAM|nr:hypothetical protein CY34DRAFT_814429 [Suillus luteus UH-Slu-Lm8-n1]
MATGKIIVFPNSAVVGGASLSTTNPFFPSSVSTHFKNLSRVAMMPLPFEYSENALGLCLISFFYPFDIKAGLLPLRLRLWQFGIV